MPSPRLASEPKYHRRSIRLKDYDYAQPGSYFITICTHNLECIFGTIPNDEMRLNEFGLIATNEWCRTADLRAKVQIDEYVVMPNHLHGIITIIDETPGYTERAPTPERFGQPTTNSIPTIVRLFKSTTTAQINALRKSRDKPVWHRNYYEHVIRSDEDLNQIREYIATNPSRWALDKNNPDLIRKP